MKNTKNTANYSTNGAVRLPFDVSVPHNGTRVIKRLRRNILRSFTGRMKSIGISRPAITVLTYHSFSRRKDTYSITPALFEAQMETIAREARFVTPEEVHEAVLGKPVDIPGVLITIDDGYADAVSILPILKKYNIPVVLFVLGAPESVNRKEIDHPGKLLSWEQIRMLDREGVTIGCHSMTHARFSKLDPDGIYREVSVAKRALEEKLGKEIRYFAYPKGIHTAHIIQAVKYAGYLMAFSVGQGCVPVRVSEYAVPRVIIDSSYLAEDVSFVLHPITARVRTFADFISGIVNSSKPATVRRRFA